MAMGGASWFRASTPRQFLCASVWLAMAKTPASPPPLPKSKPKPTTGSGEREILIESTKTPRRDQTSSGRFRAELAAKALGLRNEQVTASVVYYGAEQATSPELDAVTEAVVAQLMQFQEQLRMTAPAAVDKQELEIATISALREHLERLFGSRRENFLRFRTQDVSRRVTKLFFEAELGARPNRDEKRPKVIRWPVQGLYYALAPHLGRVEEALKAQKYASPDVHEAAAERLRHIVKDLRVEFLRQTTKDLEVVLKIIGTALATFFQDVLVPGLGDLAWRVVRESRVLEKSDGRPQIVLAAFPEFRAAFDRAFLDMLVDAMRDRVEEQLADPALKLGEDSVEFLAAPEVYVEICSIVCDSVYDYLHSEGFLDLPADWRAHLHRVRSSSE